MTCFFKMSAEFADFLQKSGKVKQIDESLQSNDFCENQGKIDLHLGPC